MLLDKNATAHLSHIKWLTAQIKMLNMFSSVKATLAKTNRGNELYEAERNPKKTSSSRGSLNQKNTPQDEPRVSIDSLKTSADFESESPFVNILSLLGQLCMMLLWFIFWAPVRLIWNKIFSKI